MSFDFADMVRKLLICEHEKTAEEAGDLVRKHADLVMQGIMRGPMAVAGAAMAIIMAEERTSSALSSRNEGGSHDLQNSQ